ncbi:MAG TPA: biotin--[acetyl-CoA-carboxylase] ligase [Dongiaceae bacterium]|nr:biotin--[acetyl-CoA-carboxylase] ligase [Dongiaceae bacterium]
MSLQFHVEHYDLVDSTNDLARDRANAGAASGLVIRADRQNAGRGRRGRSWASPPGNLYCSLLLRLAQPPAAIATLSFVTVTALGDVLSDLLPNRDVRHKWPNDLLVEGCKISGILLESAGAVTDGLPALVIGLGVNIVSHPDQTLYPVTDLAEQGAALISAADLLDRFLERFACHYAVWERGGFPAVLPAWRSRAIGIGSEIVVRLETETLTGTFLDLDRDGALLLDRPGMGVKRIAAGDIFLPGMMPPQAPATDRG